MASNTTMFIIVGFILSPEMQTALFLVLFVIYCLSVFGNIAIFSMICLEKSLHTPMYVFLSSLALEDIGFISCTVPKYLFIIATSNGTISPTDCILQLYFYMSFGSIGFTQLTFMSVDRYIAISHPLRYHCIITNHLCLCLVLASWVAGYFAFLYPIVLLSRMSFCGPLEINHFFCEGSIFVKVSCSDPSLFYLIFTASAASLVLLSFLITFVSYSYVIASVMKIPTSHGKRKAFSTCSSHLTSVIIAYGTVIFLYVRPADSVSSDLNKAVNILNSILTPFSNPFIYSLRNENMHKVMRKILKSGRRLF